VRGTHREAETVLATHVKPNKWTFGDWLAEWVEKAVKLPAKAPSTYEHYLGAINRHLQPKVGMIPLQQLKSTDLKTRTWMPPRATPRSSRARVKGRWGRRKGLAPGTVAYVHNIASAALQAAVLEGLVSRNVA
jgi:hypothetical protein